MLLGRLAENTRVFIWVGLMVLVVFGQPRSSLAGKRFKTVRVKKSGSKDVIRQRSSRLKKDIRQIRADVFGKNTELKRLKSLTPKDRAYFKIHKIINKRRTKLLSLEAKDPNLEGIINWSKRNTSLFSFSDRHLSHERGYDEETRSFLEHVVASDESQKKLLIIGGDEFELTGHLEAKASSKEVKELLSQILEVRGVGTKALVRSIVKDGVRVIYLMGNHDPHMTHPGIRNHLWSEMSKIAGLTKDEAKLFKQRVAFSGHAAFLGDKSKALVFHGQATDRVNNNPVDANPYIYKKVKSGIFGSDKTIRQLDDVTGAIISRKIDKLDELENALISSNSKPELISKASKILGKSGIFKALLIAREIAKSPLLTPAELLAQRLDDRLILKSWSKAFTKDWTLLAQDMHGIYDNMPKPLHFKYIEEKWTTKNRFELFNDSVESRKAAEGRFLSLVTMAFPDVNTILSGHIHEEKDMSGTIGSRKIRFSRTGFWGINLEQGKILNVVPGQTDSEGNTSFSKLHRWDHESKKLKQSESIEDLDTYVDAWEPVEKE